LSFDQKYTALGAGVAFHHALGVVIGVMGQRFDGHEVTGVDFDHRLEQLAEIAPVHGIGGGRHIVVARFALPRAHSLRRSRRNQRDAARGKRRRPASHQERAFQKAAPLGVQIVK
jgi:hypothetical protein